MSDEIGFRPLNGPNIQQNWYIFAYRQQILDAKLPKLGGWNFLLKTLVNRDWLEKDNIPLAIYL